ncbi:MAG: putative Ig domain-containing protein [Planctomycetia bacterium]|nr:putative Ig domain-containing protein [Planctomycetia bacterium]
MTQRPDQPKLVTSFSEEALTRRMRRPVKRVTRPLPVAKRSEPAKKQAPTTRRKKPSRHSAFQMEALETRAMMAADASDHTHSHLEIWIEGTKFAIPETVGRFQDHVEIIHTHNPHGVLHVEPGDTPETEIAVPTIGDFFTIWRTKGGIAGNKENAFFDSTRIFDHVVDATHTLKFFVNGVENTEFQNHVFDFSEELVIRYDAIANTNPTLPELPNVTLQAGAPLIVSLDGFDADGDDLTYTVQSTNPSVTGVFLNGRNLRMTVQGYGEMVFQLFEELTPRTTQRIIQLAQSGFHDGVTFHRVIDDFVLQGGDPTGSGSGGSEFGDFDDEFVGDLQHTSKGLLSMAKTVDDTNDSQFFITEVATRHLDFNHSIFGKLIEGEAVREAISEVATDDNDKPTTPVRIEGMTVFVDKQNGTLMLKAPVGTTGTSTVTVTASDGKGGTVQRSFQVTVQADGTNNNPFLLPIEEPITLVGDEPKVITLKAQDVEGNPIFFTVLPGSNLTAILGATQVNPLNQIAETTLTISRKAGFSGNTSLAIIAHPTAASSGTSGTADRQDVAVTVSVAAPIAPTGVKLTTGSDTGTSGTDGVTQRNNAANALLTFEVAGLQSGAVVRLFAGATQVGEATATGATMVISTNGAGALVDGVHNFTVTQTVGGLTSPASAPVAITIDSRTPQFTSSPVTNVFAGSLYSYDAQNDEEGGAGFLFGLISPPAGMTINAQTGAIAWTPNGSQIGVHPVTIRATDLAGNFVDQSFNVTVENSVPVLNPIGAKTVNENELLTFTATATDPNLPADVLTFSLEAGAPAGATINPTTGVFTWTPTELEGGLSFNITIRVTDQAGGFDNETIQVTVAEVNQAPALNAIGDKAIVANQLLTFTAVATDADQPAQTLAYSLGAGAPAGATINATTGVFSWTPTPAQAPGTYLITVRVSDGTAEDFEQITVFAQDVAATPVLPNLAAQTVDEGQTVALNLAAADTNLPHDRLTYAIVSGPAAATIDANGQFSWVTTEADGPGTHTFTIKVTDALGLSDTSTLTVTVNEVNQAPVLAPIGNRSVNEGELFSLIAVATDGDLPANTLTYSLANGVPAGVTINATTGELQWQTTESDGGQAVTVTVQVSDGTVQTSETITITVVEVNQAPVLAEVTDRTVDEGGMIEFAAVGTDADLPANTLTYTLDSGAPAGATIDPVTGAFRWVTTEADGPQTHTITIRVSDQLGLSDAETFTVTVNEVNTAPVLADIADRTVAERSAISFNAAATDADLPANALTYSLGSGAPAGATINPTTGLFEWAPSEAQGPGAFTITIVVTDSGGLSDTETFTVNVTEINDPPVLAEITDRTINLGSTLSLDAVATDPDVPSSGPLEYSLGAGAPAGMSIDPVTGKITWTPTAAQNNQSFDVRVIIEDATGLTDEEVFRATVNAAPVLDEILDQTIDEGTLLAITARATDDDPVAYSLATGAPSGLTIDPQTGALRWTPTEAQGPGEFEVTVVATDSGQLTAERTFTITVREANLAPVVDPVEDQSANAGDELTFTVAARDLDLPGQKLRFSLEPGSPAGASIDPVTGEFRWTVPTDFRESSVDIVIRVTDDGPGEMSATITVRVTLTDLALALFTTNGANGLTNTVASPTLLRTRNVSAVVAQQSAAHAAAAAALDRFEDVPLSDADLAYFAGRMYRLGPADGGVGPAAKIDPNDPNQRRRNEQDGASPNEQRLFKPPVEENNEQPTSGKPAVRDPQPVRNINFERHQPGVIREPLATPPVADESFDNWGDESPVELPAIDVADTVISTWLDEETAEAIAAEQIVQENDEPTQASLGLVAIPIIAGELLERRRRQREEAARRKPR